MSPSRPPRFWQNSFQSTGDRASEPAVSPGRSVGLSMLPSIAHCACITSLGRGRCIASSLADSVVFGWRAAGWCRVDCSGRRRGAARDPLRAPSMHVWPALPSRLGRSSGLPHGAAVVPLSRIRHQRLPACAAETPSCCRLVPERPTRGWRRGERPDPVSLRLWDRRPPPAGRPACAGRGVRRSDPHDPRRQPDLAVPLGFGAQPLGCRHPRSLCRAADQRGLAAAPLRNPPSNALAAALAGSEVARRIDPIPRPRCRPRRQAGSGGRPARCPARSGR